MYEYITELSKYLITVCMAVYTLLCFLGTGLGSKSRNTLVSLQVLFIFVIQFVCFADLAVVSEDVRYVIFYALVQVFLALCLNIVRLVYEDCDRMLLNNMCMLLGIGFCMISRLSFDRAVRQYCIALVSFAAAMFIPFLLNRIRVWRKLTWAYAGIGAGLLLLVLIMGTATHGSFISFTIQGITFQPSEIVKIVFVFFLAAALWEDTSPKRVIITTGLAAVYVLVLVASRDLGSALIFFVAYLFVMLFATRNYLYFLIAALGGCVGAVGAYQIFDHVRTRVLAWRDPWTYIDDQGYQITQSLFAISNGGWFGAGLYQGVPTDIPYVEEDMIFSAICEEMGAIFGMCLILVCLSCFIIMMQIGTRASDYFYKLMACGLGIMYIFQIFLTVGGSIKFIPLTGVTLPFVSYGGSSVLASMIVFFTVQGINVKQKKIERIEEKIESGRQTAAGKGKRRA